MPKMKSTSGAKKRFKKTASGKYKRLIDVGSEEALQEDRVRQVQAPEGLPEPHPVVQVVEAQASPAQSDPRLRAGAEEDRDDGRLDHHPTAAVGATCSPDRPLIHDNP